jgi:hypothetical protein
MKHDAALVLEKCILVINLASTLQCHIINVSEICMLIVLIHSKSNNDSPSFYCKRVTIFDAGFESSTTMSLNTNLEKHVFNNSMDQGASDGHILWYGTLIVNG